MVSIVPVETNAKQKPDAVLLDDDEMVTNTWSHSAKRYKRDLRTYTNRQSLLSEVDSFDENTDFYIDSNLGDDKGEEVVKILHAKGFKRLFIASGSPKSDKSIAELILGLVPKTPPWIQKS